MPFVEIKLNAGRPPATKARLAKALTQVFVDQGVCAAEHVWIVFDDKRPHDWATGGETLAERAARSPTE